MSAISITLNQSGPTSMTLANDVAVVVDRPIEKGGGGTGLMGGQYLLTGIAGCFCSTLFAAAQARDIEVTDLRVELIAQLSDNLPRRFSKVTLDTEYGTCSKPSEWDSLVRIAEKGCLSINTVKVGMEFAVNSKLNRS